MSQEVEQFLEEKEKIVRQRASDIEGRLESASERIHESQDQGG